MRRTSHAAALGACACASVALWLSGGSLALTDAAHLDTRLALLPPIWLLIALVAAGALASVSGRLTAKRALPLAGAVVLLLPWLPLSVPAAALVWAGPLRVVMWGALALGVVFAVDAPLPRRLSALGADPRRAPIVAAAAALVLYAAGYWVVSPRLPGGDEPHYLIITQSLLRDHDVQIENNHRRGDYREYFTGQLPPDYLRRGVNGQIYSVHAPGLPAVVAPAFALGGYHGVVAFLILVAALTTAMVWRLAYRVSGDPSAAWFAWGAIGLSATFFFHAFTIFPEMLGAAIVVWTLTLLVDPPPAPVSAGRMAAHGAALALLPWLHTRYATLAAALGLVVAIRHGVGRNGVRRLFSLFLIPAVSAAAWFLFFYVVYGTPNPAAPYGPYTQTSIWNIPRGVTGLLIDQQFGLLPSAPVLAFALWGLIRFARRRPRLAVELAAIALPYVLATASYYMWWGGASAPARFVVPVVPLLAVPAAVWFASSRSGARAAAWSALALSIAITATLVLVDRGALAYQFRDGVSRLLEMAAPLVDLPHAAPSLFRETPAAAWRDALVWIAMLAAALGAANLAGRWRGRAAGILTGLVALPCAAMVAMTIVWRVWHVAGPTPASSQVALLEAYRGPRTRGFDYHSFHVIRADAIVQSLRIRSTSRRLVRGVQPLLAVDGLPPGVYAVDVRQHRLGEGALSIDIGQTPIGQWSTASTGTPEAEHRLTLPVGVPSLFVRGDPPAQTLVSDVTLRALRITPVSDRLTAATSKAVARYGDAVVFGVGDGAYVEPGGVWIGPGADAELVVSSVSGASAVQMSVGNGPVPNSCTLRSPAWKRTLQMTPGDRADLTLPVPIGAAGVLLGVSSATGFVPADYDRKSTDRRVLGCRIEFR